MQCPFFRVDGKVGPCPSQVDESNQDVGDAYFGGHQNPPNELGEFFDLVYASGCASSRSGGEIESVFDGLNRLLDDSGYGKYQPTS